MKTKQVFRSFQLVCVWQALLLYDMIDLNFHNKGGDSNIFIMRSSHNILTTLSNPEVCKSKLQVVSSAFHDCATSIKFFQNN